MTSFLSALRRERYFLVFIGFLTLVIAATYQVTSVAMWIGFALAAFSAIGNDSIQTLGTFLTSNKKMPWWVLWFFIGGLFVAVTYWGWRSGQGVDFGRLEKIQPVESFHFLQIFAPAVLLLITRFGVPVSTTFLILSMFATSKTIESMVLKTISGYLLSFAVAVLVFGLVSKVIGKWMNKPLSKRSAKFWRVAQWGSTAFLWGSWLMQDTANVVVFLPRVLSFEAYLAVGSLGFLLIGILIYTRGGPIQKIVEEKRDVIEVRAATLIDLTMAFVLIYFKQMNSIPMSTTWVFLGLLAGRELILTYCHPKTDKNDYQKAGFLVFKDIGMATLGLFVSIALVFLMRYFS